MQTWKKLAATLVVTALAGAALAAGTTPMGDVPTRDSVKKSALASHPGKIDRISKENREGKEVWKVKVKGQDGKEHVLYYDGNTGTEVKHGG